MPRCYAISAIADHSSEFPAFFSALPDMNELERPTSVLPIFDIVQLRRILRVTTPNRAKTTTSEVRL